MWSGRDGQVWFEYSKIVLGQERELTPEGRFGNNKRSIGRNPERRVQKRSLHHMRALRKPRQVHSVAEKRSMGGAAKPEPFSHQWIRELAHSLGKLNRMG